MDFNITINCDNAAFGDSSTDSEVIDILEKIINTIRNGDLDAKIGEKENLYDSNGNFVGQVKYID